LGIGKRDPWFEFGGENWDRVAQFKKQSGDLFGRRQWDVHVWLENEDGEIFDVISQHVVQVARIRRKKVDCVAGQVIDGVSREVMADKGLTYVDAPEVCSASYVLRWTRTGAARSTCGWCRGHLAGRRCCRGCLPCWLAMPLDVSSIVLLFFDAVIPAYISIAPDILAHVVLASVIYASGILAFVILAYVLCAFVTNAYVIVAFALLASAILTYVLLASVILAYVILATVILACVIPAAVIIACAMLASCNHCICNCCFRDPCICTPGFCNPCVCTPRICNYCICSSCS
jgi:hypothetical protein